MRFPRPLIRIVTGQAPAPFVCPLARPTTTPPLNRRAKAGVMQKWQSFDRHSHFLIRKSLSRVSQVQHDHLLKEAFSIRESRLFLYNYSTCFYRLTLIFLTFR